MMINRAILLGFFLIIFLGMSSALTTITDLRIDTPTLNATNSTLFSILGIGTTTPTQTLDVRGHGNFSGDIWIGNSTSINMFLYNYSSIPNANTFNASYDDFAYNQTDPAITSINTSYNPLWYNHTLIARDYLNTTYGLFWFNQSNLAVNILNITYNSRWYNYSTVSDTTIWQYNFTTGTYNQYNNAWTATHNDSYFAINSSSYLAFLLNTTMHNNVFNLTSGVIHPFNTYLPICIGSNCTSGNSTFQINGNSTFTGNLSLANQASIVSNASGTQRTFITSNASGCWIIKGLTSEVNIC